MKRIFCFFLLAVACISFSGCANTAQGVTKDTKENWDVLKEWDEKFQEKYW